MANVYDDEFELCTLVDEDGVEQEFEKLGELEVDGNIYCGFVPHTENPEELLNENVDLVILKLTTENGEEVLATIDDEDEYNRVGEIFMNELYGEDEE